MKKVPEVVVVEGVVVVTVMPTEGVGLIVSAGVIVTVVVEGVILFIVVGAIVEFIVIVEDVANVELVVSAVEGVAEESIIEAE